MSRLTQYIAFINAEKAPTEMEMKHLYPNIIKTDALMKYRRKYLKK